MNLLLDPHILKGASMMRRLFRLVTSVTTFATFAFGLGTVTANTAHAAVSPYCVTLQKFFATADTVKNPKPGDVVKLMNTMAASLRSSKPPKEFKSAVENYASWLESAAKKYKGVTSKADIAKADKELKQSPAAAKALNDLLTVGAKNCAGVLG